MRTAPALLTALALLFAASSARAEPDQATKDLARQIATEGLNLFDSGEFAAALERFRRAEAMVHAPTMHLMAARSLVKLGRLVEANQEYLATTRTELPPDASDAFKNAVVDAAKEQSALLSRIPTVVIKVSAREGDPITASLDGKAIAAASLGKEQLADPGAHSVVATAGGVTKSAPIELKEGEKREIALDLQPPSTPGSPMRTAGFVGLGVGLAAVAVGAVVGGIAVGKKSDLDKVCPGALCGTDKTADVSGYDTLRTVSSVGFYGGAVLAVGGAVLLLAAPSSKPVVGSVRWSPFVGLGSAGVQGVF